MTQGKKHTQQSLMDEMDTLKVHLRRKQIEFVAERMWQDDSIRAAGRRRRVAWADIDPDEQTRWIRLAQAAEVAFIMVGKIKP